MVPSEAPRRRAQPTGEAQGGVPEYDRARRGHGVVESSGCPSADAASASRWAGAPMSARTRSVNDLIPLVVADGAMGRADEPDVSVSRDLAGRLVADLGEAGRFAARHRDQLPEAGLHNVVADACPILGQAISLSTGDRVPPPAMGSGSPGGPCTSWRTELPQDGSWHSTKRAWTRWEELTAGVLTRLRAMERRSHSSRPNCLAGAARRPCCGGGKREVGALPPGAGGARRHRVPPRRRRRVRDRLSPSPSGLGRRPRDRTTRGCETRARCLAVGGTC